MLGRHGSCGAAPRHALRFGSRAGFGLQANSALGLFVPLPPRSPGQELLELQEFYERMERARTAAVEAAVKKYRSLTPILCKVGAGVWAGGLGRE
jgi:hypothetical protein